MSKNPAADLAKKRWKGTTDEERSELMTAAVNSRWANKTAEERKAVGARLAQARAKKRKAGAKKAKAGKLNFEETMQQVKAAMTVTAAMALRQESRLKEHAEWIATNERANARHQEWMEEHRAAMGELDRKLDRIAELMLKGRGGNGNAARS